MEKVRLLLAIIISPLIMPLMVYATFAFMLGGDVEKNKEIQTGINAAIWSSYVLALGFGGVSYFLLRKKGWWTVWRYLLMGTASGFSAWVLFSLASQTFVSLLFYVFLAAGAMMGIFFWLIAYFQPDGNHLISSSSSRRRRRRSR